jgi:hypothetical protein
MNCHADSICRTNIKIYTCQHLSPATSIIGLILIDIIIGESDLSVIEHDRFLGLDALNTHTFACLPSDDDNSSCVCLHKQMNADHDC